MSVLMVLDRRRVRQELCEVVLVIRVRYFSLLKAVLRAFSAIDSVWLTSTYLSVILGLIATSHADKHALRV